MNKKKIKDWFIHHFFSFHTIPTHPENNTKFLKEYKLYNTIEDSIEKDVSSGIKLIKLTVRNNDIFHDPINIIKRTIQDSIFFDSSSQHLLKHLHSLDDWHTQYNDSYKIIYNYTLSLLINGGIQHYKEPYVFIKLSFNNHMAVAILHTETHLIEVFDPSCSTINKARINTILTLAFPHLPITIKHIVNINVQKESDTSKTIDIYCRMWVLHFIDFVKKVSVPNVDKYNTYLNSARTMPGGFLTEIKEFMYDYINQDTIDYIKEQLKN